MGDIVGILIALIPILVVLLVLYHIIRMAVKKGIIEAYEELGLRNSKSNSHDL